VTVTDDKSAVEKPVEMVSCTIDGFEIEVPKGTLIIRAAELLGIQIPRFCDHPLLDPVGACRQCLVEIPDAGNGRGMPKPQASCTTTVMPGMVVKTQLTSPVADKAQHGVMELLLINHPLDCPICDKGGECPLQNQAMSNGRGESRFVETKRTFPKPIPLSSQVLLDRERCIQCARCTRFSDQIAGDAFIDLFERGAKEQVGAADGKPFQSYFSGNTVQICPVGALTGAAYRFRSRPFDLVSQPSVCEHCASGCALRTDHRRGKITRRLAGDDPQVNEEWNCDKGRWAFTYGTRPERLTHPLVRGENGELEVASWPEALTVAARGLAAARGSAGVLTGGRVTLEDAYAYAKFARIALHTNDVDFRARPLSDEESRFLASSVAGRPIEVSYADLEKAPVVVLAGFEPEEESPIVFLRLRKAFRKNGLKVFGIAPFATRGLRKVGGTLLATAPGSESETLGSLIGDPSRAGVRTLLETPGAVIMLGERLATSPGALTSAVRLAQVTGARLAWVPRRAGDRGAVEAGALPNLLPGGRPVADPAARVDLAAAWGVDTLPDRPGRDAAGIVEALREGKLRGAVVGGVDPADMPRPKRFRKALKKAEFVVALEVRESEVTRLADVVLPVAPAVEKAGMFVNWEGRVRPFPQALQVAGALPDLRSLAGIAAEMGSPLGFSTVAEARAEMEALGPWDGARIPMADEVVQQPSRDQVTGSRDGAGAPPRPAGSIRLSTWKQSIDNGRMIEGEKYLQATARPPVAVLPPELYAAHGPLVTITGDRGSVTLRATAAPDMVADTVWVPASSLGAGVLSELASPGSTVTISGGHA
jgi:NADH-quinone oxidoreductase subunit G